MLSEASRQVIVHLQLVGVLKDSSSSTLMVVPNFNIDAYFEDIVIALSGVPIACIEVKKTIGNYLNGLDHSDLTELFLYAQHIFIKRRTTLFCALTDAETWFGFYVASYQLGTFTIRIVLSKCQMDP